MLGFLLATLAFQGLVILVWGFRRRDRLIQYPILAAGVFLGWVLPQLVGLANNPYLPPGGLEKTILLANLCLGAAWVGYVTNKRPARLFQWRFDGRRLLVACAFLSLAGAFFFYQISLLAPEAGTRWTGIITIYYLFSKLLTVGLVIAVVLHMTRPSWATLAIIAFDLVFYFDRIIIKGRRSAMVELGLMLLMALWFHRRWAPPRVVVVTMLVAGMLVINSIGEYRATMLNDDLTTWSGANLNDLLEIDYVGNLSRIAQGEAANGELTNAVMDIEATDRQLRFDFGLAHWNGLVRYYVPGQWVGSEVKEALTFDFGNPAFEELRHVSATGNTSTGLSDVFQSFWYFGAGVFFLIGLIMSRWYRAALMGNVAAEMVLMLSLPSSLVAITHSTQLFSMMFVQIVAFLVPALLWARAETERSAAPAAQMRVPHTVSGAIQ
ncbi:hypothetical protein [Mesorhizobium sp.]|uniref:hypothetical protein n=1 Tax=Mesorhizobium sp. TaxID=1871066 RepID=UPI0011F78F71|nr:hypothetical protein [Mesorhizobium sp.]TIN26418.1 MAG: hypothetical protein E5Y19_13675 [Mesorhizobium sp.]